MYKLPKMKELVSYVNNTGNKFRNVKFLRKKLQRVQREDDELSKLKKCKNPKGYKMTPSTRFGSQHTCTEHALLINDSAERVVVCPSYKEKYEAADVGDHQGESDDEYAKKDRRSLSQILAECKTEWIMNTT